MPPVSSGEDIPLARRSARPAPRRSSPLGKLAWLLTTCAVITASVLLLLRGPLRQLITPPPVEGLNARLTTDGRLLGHFPYPEAASKDLVTISPGLQLRRDAAASLAAMRRDAASDGVNLVVLSAFRPVAQQKQIFFDIKAQRNQTSPERAQVSAPPGFSEHSTGYAVDLGDGRLPSTNLSGSFEGTAAFRWLKANAARFQFHLSFPYGNAQGVSYEPWHWRWEGSIGALRVFEPAHRLARRPPG